MSCNYADGLSSYENKGVCGLKEIVDDAKTVEEKVKFLAQVIKDAKHVVVHTGAGISTAAGIPDFRGPNGVWTLEKRGEKPTINISFNDAVPTKTHMILVSLIHSGYIHFLVSQNIDGLHLRSNFPPDRMAELHGNMFLDRCNKCKRLFVRNTAAETVGQKFTGMFCPIPKKNGRVCRGKLYDTILDWEDELPQKDLEMADFNCRKADLSICLGTTLQIVPSGTLPLLTKKSGGELVICNLQPTKHDKSADLLIHGYTDDILTKLAKFLDIDLPEYKVSNDPTKFRDEKVREYVFTGVPFKNDCNKIKKEYHSDVIENEGNEMKQENQPNKENEDNEMDVGNQTYVKSETKEKQSNEISGVEEDNQVNIKNKDNKMEDEYQADILKNEMEIFSKNDIQ